MDATNTDGSKAQGRVYRVMGSEGATARRLGVHFRFDCATYAEAQKRGAELAQHLDRAYGNGCSIYVFNYGDWVFVEECR